MAVHRSFQVKRYLHADEEHEIIGQAETFFDAVAVCERDYGGHTGDGLWFDLLPPKYENQGYVINLPDRNYTIIIGEEVE